VGISQQGVDMVLTKESIRSVVEKLEHTLYGYFLGDRLAYPVVEYFVKNNWNKYGLQKIMMNANGFFFFKFDDANGMMDVLKDGPWLIRNKPLFINVWTPATNSRRKILKRWQFGLNFMMFHW
jgi:hypothetical protein